MATSVCVSDLIQIDSSRLKLKAQEILQKHVSYRPQSPTSNGN